MQCRPPHPFALCHRQRGPAMRAALHWQSLRRAHCVVLRARLVPPAIRRPARRCAHCGTALRRPTMAGACRIAGPRAMRWSHCWSCHCARSAPVHWSLVGPDHNAPRPLTMRDCAAGPHCAAMQCAPPMRASPACSRAGCGLAARGHACVAAHSASASRRRKRDAALRQPSRAARNACACSRAVSVVSMLVRTQ